MTDHIIFDLDGTLVDSCTICVDLLGEMIIERGGTEVIDPLVARKYMSRGGAQMVEALLGTCSVDPEADLKEFRARYLQRDTPLSTLFSGVAAGIAALHENGLTLSICSNKPQPLCEKVLRDTQLEQYFSVVVGGQAGLRPKPQPDLLQAVLERTGARAENCLFVGDSPLDCTVARDANMAFHFMTYGYCDEGWTPPDAKIFDDFEDLTRSLLQRCSSRLGGTLRA